MRHFFSSASNNLILWISSKCISNFLSAIYGLCSCLILIDPFVVEQISILFIFLILIYRPYPLLCVKIVTGAPAHHRPPVGSDHNLSSAWVSTLRKANKDNNLCFQFLTFSSNLQTWQCTGSVYLIHVFWSVLATLPSYFNVSAIFPITHFYYFTQTVLLTWIAIS